MTVYIKNRLPHKAISKTRSLINPFYYSTVMRLPASLESGPSDWSIFYLLAFSFFVVVLRDKRDRNILASRISRTQIKIIICVSYLPGSRHFKSFLPNDMRTFEKYFKLHKTALEIVRKIKSTYYCVPLVQRSVPTRPKNQWS